VAKVELNIVRGDEEQGRSLVNYEVPFVEGMSLLDAIFWIRENNDPTLAVRYSCKSANACKECMALVDGKAGYLCSIRANENKSATIEPLKARPWVKDLVTSLE
jgi:succinate dehydrogenase/fumarate reductase-like Fe-S protein